MTGQRRTIAAVLDESSTIPTWKSCTRRAAGGDARISHRHGLRTVKLFEEAGMLEKLEFGDGRARYEDAERDHHDHLIDMPPAR